MVDAYTSHKFPIACMAIGSGYLSRVGITAGSDRGFGVYDFDKCSSEQPKDYSLAIGHSAIVNHITLASNYLVSGSVNGDLKVAAFDSFSKELGRSSSIITLKSWWRSANNLNSKSGLQKRYLN